MKTFEEYVGESLKPSAKEIKSWGAQAYGWAGFKHALMSKLGIPDSQFDKWDVPPEWAIAFKRAGGQKGISVANPFGKRTKPLS